MAARENIIGAPINVPGAQPLGGASAEAFGAGIGRGMSQLGATIHEATVRAKAAEREREQDAAVAAAGAALPELTTRISIGAKDMEEAAPEDGAGHAEAVGKFAKAETDAFLAGITDPKVRDRYAPLASGVAARALDEADTYARGLRSKSIPINFKRGTDGWGVKLQSSGDERDYEAALEERATTVAGLAVRPEVRSALLQEANRTLTNGYFDGKIKKDPAAALLLLTTKDEEAAEYRAYLKPEDVGRLIDRAQTEVKVRENDVAKQLGVAARQAKDGIDSFLTLVDAGDMPTDATFDQHIAAATALGGGSLVTRLQVKRATVRVTRDTEKWTPTDWAREITALEAKGDKRSTGENVRLEALKERRQASEQRFNNAPHEAAAASGAPPPPIDLDNLTPAQAADRKSWARAWAATAGQAEPSYLNVEETKAYRARAEQGVAGQIDLAAELRGKWGDAAGAIVRQIGGDTAADLRVMVGLPPRMAEVYRLGNSALKRNPKLADADQARAIFAEYQAGIPPSLRDAMFDAARAITAGYADQVGVAELKDEDFAKAFRQGVHRAAGMLGAGNERTGGLADWNGRFVWLPPDMSRDDLARRITRATPQAWIAAAVDRRGQPTNGVPHHLGPNGKLVPYKNGEGMRFKHGRLKTVDAGIYQLIDERGGEVVDSRGQPWLVDARRLK